MLSLCIWYLDKNVNIENNEIKNDMLRDNSLPIISVIGQNLTLAILDTLKKIGTNSD